MARKPSPDELRKLKEKAADAAAKGRFDRAAELYRAAADGDPRDAAARQKLADTLRRAGRLPEAIATYGEVADLFARDGLLIKAIAISKTILELDPAHVQTQQLLAELYAQRARADRARPPARTMAVQAVRAVAAPPPRPAPGEPEEAVVSLSLAPPRAHGAPAVAPPPPDLDALDITIDAEPMPGPDLPVEVGPPAPLAAAAEAEAEQTLDGQLLEPIGEEPAPAAVRPPPPARPQAALEAAAPPPPARHPTAFSQIVHAAEVAAQAGIEEDLLIQADPVDAPVIDDEPLGPPDAASGGLPPSDEGVELVVEPPPVPPVPPALPRIPIFSDVSRDAFLALTAGMVLHRAAAGERVIREGDEGTSFYVVAGGRLAVTKRDEGGRPLLLAHLRDGDFFGEMALLSGAPRAATVTAEVESELLEFRAERLLEVAGQHPHVARSLRKFYRQRLLANALALSPIFRPFQRGDRARIMERFRAREVVEDEVVIREGEPSDGLYVVLEGAVDVVKARGGQAVAVSQLREGDLFGEMSCLRKTPASASVVVRRPGTLLRLPRKAFDELVTSYPQILELVANLSEERAEGLDAILSGHAEWTDEGLLLT